MKRPLSFLVCMTSTLFCLAAASGQTSKPPTRLPAIDAVAIPAAAAPGPILAPNASGQVGLVAGEYLSGPPTLLDVTEQLDQQRELLLHRPSCWRSSEKSWIS